MGRNSNIVESPVVKTLKWKNEKTKKDPKTKETVVLQETGWYYYDKNANEGEGAEFKVDLPIDFIWLETANSIMGYSAEQEASIWSNEVLNTKDQILEVRVGKNIEYTGLYKDIKDQVKGIGGKFCCAVYVLVNTDEGEEIWRFLMKGSSTTAWIGFFNPAKAKNSKISCVGSKYIEGKIGGYEEPVFKYLPLSQEENDRASKVEAEQIAPYFKYLLSKNVEEEDTSDY